MLSFRENADIMRAASREGLRQVAAGGGCWPCMAGWDCGLCVAGWRLRALQSWLAEGCRSCTAAGLSCSCTCKGKSVGVPGQGVLILAWCREEATSTALPQESRSPQQQTSGEAVQWRIST
jgi:hypothetical protein